MCSIFFSSTSSSKIGDLECEQEVEGDDEGVLPLEWREDVDLLAIYSQALLLVPNMLKARKIGAPTRGITT